MRCSRNRLGSDAASADRSRPSSTNTGTSGSACAILLETRRTRRRAWRRNPRPSRGRRRRTRPASRSPKESEKGGAAGRDASATRGAAATGTARAGSARRDRKRCAYIAKGPKLGLDVGGRRVELCCAVVVPRSFQKPRLVQDGVPDSKRRAVLAHDVTDGQQSLRPPLAVH